MTMLLATMSPMLLSFVKIIKVNGTKVASKHVQSVVPEENQGKDAAF